MKKWHDEIIECTVNNYNNREVVIWGSHKTAEVISKRLFLEYNIKTVFFVDSNSKLVDDYYVRRTSILKDNSNKYYVVVPLSYYDSIKKSLINWGYYKDRDYCYWTDCIIENTDDYYEDSHGNKVFGYHRNIHFMFCGYNATVKIDDYIKNDGALQIYIHSNAKIVLGIQNHICGKIIVCSNCIINIGSNNQILCKDKLTFYKNSIVSIGDGNILNMCSSQVHENASLFIGSNNTSSGNLKILVYLHTQLIIGNDCMMSTEVIMQTNDGHAIFDIKTGVCTNATKEILESRKIVLGDHVWIGRRVLLLYNSMIGSGSIIGAQSLVKSEIPNNCIAVGIPARVIKRDIAWTRKAVSENILDCGEEYINFTK